MNFSAAKLRVDAMMFTGAILLTAAAGAIAVGPSLLARGPTSEQQKQDLEARKKQAAALDQELDAARAHFASLSTESTAVVHLEPAERINQRLAKMSELAERANVSVAQITPAPPAPPAPTGGAPSAPGHSAADALSLVVPIKLSGTGSYPTVTRFLHTLHAELRDTAVVGVHMNVAPGERAVDNTQAGFVIDLAWHAALADSAAQVGASPKP